MSMKAETTANNAAKILQEAARLMNDEGRHWIQGAFQQRINGESFFCSVGAIDHAVAISDLGWDERTDARETAMEAPRARTPQARRLGLRRGSHHPLERQRASQVAGCRQALQGRR